MKCLIKYGIDIDKENENGETSSFYANERGNEKYCKIILVKNGGNIGEENMYDETKILNTWDHGHENKVKY